MKRVAAYAILLGCILGCQGSQQSFNLLAPHGSTRVPPPATGNHTAPAGYYSPATPPTVNVPTIQSSPTLGAPSAQANPTNNAQYAAGTWQPAGGSTGAVSQTPTSGVQQASFTTPAKSGASSSSLNLNGMHVNDATSATTPTAPAAFAPPSQTAPIPQPTTAGGTVVSSAKASDNISPGTMPSTASTESTLKWGSR